MSAIEGLAWSAIVVTVLSLGVFTVSSLLRKLGVALGTVPAFVLLALIPLLTVAPFLPQFSFGKSPATQPIYSGDDAAVDQKPVAAAFNVALTPPKFSQEDLVHPIVKDEPKPVVSAAPFVDWKAISDRLLTLFRVTAPWLAGLLLAGLILGWLRLGIGWLSIRKLVRTSKPINDSELFELLDVLQAEYRCATSITLKESDQVESPATMGWNKPVILLPTDWRAWTEDERKAILAHEMAHIRRGDYGTWLVAQTCAALHYLNPVVRGVANWLRLEQEVAADADAARLAGGRHNYLRVLANLAVRSRDVNSGWPARCFLPTQGSFVRRIEMLRSLPPRWSVRTAIGKACLMLAIMVAAFTLSAFRPAIASPIPSSNAVVADDMFPIPQTAIAVGQIRLAQLQENPKLAPVVKTIGGRAMETMKAIGIKFEDLDRVGLILLATDKVQDFDNCGVLVANTNWSADKLFQGRMDVTRERESGMTVYRTSMVIHGILVNPRTLILPGKMSTGEKVLRSLQGPKHERLSRLMSEGSTGIACFATSGAEFFAPVMSRPTAGMVLLTELMKPVLKDQQHSLLKMELDASLRINATAEYSNAESAKNAGKTVEAGIIVLGNQLASVKDRIPPAERDLVDPMVKVGEMMLKSSSVSVDGKSLMVKSSVDGFDSILPAATILGKMQASAHLMKSQNNLKQIGLAFLHYADVHGKFPAASKPDANAKFPVSWRVKILPYLEQDLLYRQYKFDEPWDGPNNRKLLKKMPDIYRNPSAPHATETPYRVFVGEKTIFPDGGGAGLAEILDGTSNTIMMVESQSTVPWTKPEDLEHSAIDPSKLGGVSPRGFSALFADGSVRFLPHSVNVEVLKAMLTRNGAEVLPEN